MARIRVAVQSVETQGRMMITEADIAYKTGHMMPGDNDHLVPPDWFLNRRLADEPRDMQLHKRGVGLPTVITFSGAGLNPETGEAMYAMQAFLKDSAINVIMLRDQACAWFHGGVRGISTDVASTVQYLQRLLGLWNSSRVLCTGASAGGYAAILFGVLLNATGVIALNPQTLLKRGVQCQAHGWLYMLKWCDGEGTWTPTKQQYADLLDLPPSDTRIEIVYGADDPVDCFHAERMSAWPNVHLDKQAGTHGTTIVQARDTGLLAQLFGDVLAVPIWEDA